MVFLFALALIGQASTQSAAPAFRDEVAPILRAHCVECHNAAKTGGGDYNDNEGYSAGWVDDTMVYTDSSHMPWMDKFGQKANTNFGYLHPSKFMAVFCDGSVHYLNDNMSVTTLAALSTRAYDDIIGESY